MKLTDIHSPQDIKTLSVDALADIAEQMRAATLGRCAAIGGHVGPNLGDAESVIALHYVFDAPKDKIVFDVSHQDFPHKMLTGRADGFLTPEGYRKIGEYTDPKESPEYDLFYAGHTSPSISLAVGLAKARQLAGDDYNVVAFIGDGSLSGGEAFEGLDAGAALNDNFIVVVNDNQMAIAENHGGMYAGLQRLRETNGTDPSNIFRAMGYDYVYVGEGNDLRTLIDTFRRVKGVRRPTVVHINTQKGLGYEPAERDREYWHWSVPFDIPTGDPLSVDPAPTYESITRDFLLARAKSDPLTLIISSATPDTFDLGPEERRALGRQYIDVAIAEQTGVSVMAGAARGGAHPVYVVMATFLQRAYDQLVEDWAMNPGASLMIVAGGGIKGVRDQTHLGFWDIPMITSIPDIVYLAPTSVEEYEAMLQWAVNQKDHKVAIRIPTYEMAHATAPVDKDYSVINRFKIEHQGSKVAIIAAGDMMGRAREAAEILRSRGVDPTIINPRFISGVDEGMLTNLMPDHQLVVTLEDGSVEGGFGQRVAAALGMTPMKVMVRGLAKKFVDRYRSADLETANGLTANQLATDILSAL